MRLFVDLDGTLAQFKYVPEEELYKKGYFLNLEPLNEVVHAVNRLAEKGHDIWILSAYLIESEYALVEKSKWAEKYLPDIRRIFIPCGNSKAQSVENAFGRKLSADDILLDDHTANLFDFERHGGTAVKLLNGMNGKNGKWQGAKVSRENCYIKLCEVLKEKEEVSTANENINGKE